MRPFLLALIVAVAGCGAYQRKTMEDDFQKNGIPKASFDMNCAVDQLTATALTDDAMSFGVRGCGKQARYQYAQGAGWVLDAASVSEPATP
jgi:hypothetical protein